MTRMTCVAVAAAVAFALIGVDADARQQGGPAASAAVNLHDISGFWALCAFFPSSSRSRSAPLQRGKYQSLRICLPPFSFLRSW